MDKVQRFTVTSIDRQTVQKHRGRWLGQGRQGFGTGETTAQADNPMGGRQQERYYRVINQEQVNRNQERRG